MTTKQQPQRLPDGKFSPGTSGNPSGRPKSANSKLRKNLGKHGPEIIQILIDQALEGDTAAAKIILDRILPPLRPTAAPVSIPLPYQANHSEIAQAILSAAAQGAIPSDTAAQLITATANLARIHELEDIKPRLEALERILKTQ